MGRISVPPPVKFFVGVLTSQPGHATEIEDRLCAELGPVDLRSETFPFDHTDYYESQMGRPIVRSFLAFSELRSGEELAGIKRRTNEMEEALAQLDLGVARPVNLDPGYVEQAKVVLASTKNFYHRILLADGIYAEATMHFENGGWKPFAWTFPDFRSGLYNPFFTRLRELYRSQLRSRCQLPREDRSGR